MPMTTLPPGFRFHPTDVELVCYYLKRKIMGKPIHFEAISEIELYKFAPWDLPGKSCLRGRDLEWYFFCVGEKKYSNGLRKNRATTEVGYWKTTGKDKPISYNSRTIAMKKTLVFHEAKVQDGRTDWVMHEYRLEDVALAGAGFLQDAYVLCKIFKNEQWGEAQRSQRNFHGKCPGGIFSKKKKKNLFSFLATSTPPPLLYI
ncbi:unnamed protein product [Spirodela intermedia]|uniref:NAC domain-containing protein n=1 Tax=Spirodela intermedia TaxID=51605 RepID=A0A7I8JC01_SPIIN|nr:unnamed protein product [Spirodela intermedia]CAA6667718.1 unnamed protein product [Spirodela intermedia]